MTVSTIAAGLAPGQAVFAIGGSALLLPYYLGILHTLVETGYITPGLTPMAGISGGGLTSAAACAGISAEYVLNWVLDSATKHPKDIWAVRPTIIHELGKHAPPGTFLNCSGKVHIALSHLNKSSSSLNGSTTLIVTNFTSDIDYWNATVGTSTLACAGYDPKDPSCGGPPFVSFRDEPVMDGAYANSLTTLCNALGQPYGGSNTTCVSMYTYEPGAFRKYTASRRAPTTGTCANNASLLPNQAQGWNLPTDCGLFPNGQGLPDFTNAFDVDGVWPSIFPGCDPRNPINFTREEWQEMAMDAAKAGPYMRQIYEYGRVDAQLWVVNQTTTVTGATLGAPQASADSRSRSRSVGGDRDSPKRPGDDSSRGDGRRARRLL